MPSGAAIADEWKAKPSPDPIFIKMLNKDFVPIMVNGDSKKQLNIDGYKITERDLAQREYRVRGYPAFWFLKPDSERLGMLNGYQQADNFLEVLYYMKDALYNEMTFEEYMKAGGYKARRKG